MLVFIAALQRELRAMKALLDEGTTSEAADALVTEGQVEGRPVALVRCGIGRELAQEATRRMILRARPRAIVSTGFSGALSGDVGGGDLLIADRVTSPLSDEAADSKPAPPIEADPYLLEAAIEAMDGCPVRSHVGGLVTVAKVLATRIEKDTVTNIATKAVDMESYWVAEIAKEAGVPFLAVRAISDEVDDTLPDYERFETPMGGIRPFAAAWYFATRPWHIFDLPRLASNARHGTKNLAIFAGRFLAKVYREAPVTQ